MEMGISWVWKPKSTSTVWSSNFITFKMFVLFVFNQTIIDLEVRTTSRDIVPVLVEIRRLENFTLGLSLQSFLWLVQDLARRFGLIAPFASIQQ